MTEQNYLVLAPLFATSGDADVVFEGSDLAFVLREIDDCIFNVIGAAYVHGFMDGQAMEGRDIRNFTLI